MQIMTNAERTLLDKLTRLARGNDSLVLEAMRRTARANGPTPLRDIVAYIMATRASAQESKTAPLPPEIRADGNEAAYRKNHS